MLAMFFSTFALVFGAHKNVYTPSCCLDLHEKQWTLAVHQAVGAGKNLTDLSVNGIGMYSNGNCMSNVSAVGSQCGNHDNGGQYIATEHLMGIQSYNRTFRVITVVEDGKPLVQCTSTPGVSCDDASAVDLLFFSEVSTNFCFTEFERNISLGGLQMQLYTFHHGAAIVNTAADCAIVGFLGPDNIPHLSPFSSYYDFGPAKPTPESFDVPSECFTADGSFV